MIQLNGVSVMCPRSELMEVMNGMHLNICHRNSFRVASDVLSVEKRLRSEQYLPHRDVL